MSVEMLQQPVTLTTSSFLACLILHPKKYRITVTYKLYRNPDANSNDVTCYTHYCILKKSIYETSTMYHTALKILVRTTVHSQTL